MMSSHEKTHFTELLHSCKKRDEKEMYMPELVKDLLLKARGAFLSGGEEKSKFTNAIGPGPKTPPGNEISLLHPIRVQRAGTLFQFPLPA